MKAVAAPLMTLLLFGAPRVAAAQLSSSLDAQLNDMRARASFVTMGGFDNMRAGSAAGAFGIRAGFPLAHARLDLDGGLLTMPSAGDAVSAGVRVTLPVASDVSVRFRVAAARQGGDSVLNAPVAGLEVVRGRMSLGFQTDVMRGMPALYHDTILALEGDTTATAPILVRPRQPDRIGASIVGGYRYAYSRWEVNGIVTARVADAQRNSVSGLVSAAVRLTPEISLGATFGREPGFDWMGRARRNTTMVFLRMDAPTHPLPAPHVVVASPRVTVTTGDATIISVFSSDAVDVEITGDFSDWQPVKLRRDGASWRYTAALKPGLYHIRVRVNRGEWTAPAGLPVLHDDFGDVAGVFEVTGST